MNEPPSADNPASTNESLPERPSTGPELLAELADEFAARYRRGERPDVEQFARQYPALASEIRDLFPAMVAMEDAAAGASPAPPARAQDEAGSLVGRYKLLERLGEGGFGVVYMAEQLTPVRRKVALKVIKAGLDTRQVIARFEAERQALALMDHENIAKVLDAGATDAGRPYFVMELVHGVPITEYCENNGLTPRQRLDLFVRVCRAVQHAHTKGIIHRDLKPTNVLVTLHDGVAVPKVIDFGVAKATGQQPLTEKTLFTQFAQMVGTPLYMSPEQAEMSGLDVDTRSDVYSLGVLLYELLTGTTPLDRERLKRAALDEVRRIIREEEPPQPSTRISTLSGKLPAASAERRGELRKLGRLVRGELDWIVMKALEKDRARRYETASDFAADVERSLRDEAVQAGPPSATYRVRKLLQRHRGRFVATSLVVLTMAAGIVATTWGVGRWKDQRYQALLSGAHAKRLGGGLGQRFQTLELIQQAAKIRATSELREEAAAALLLPDAEVAQEWADTDPLGGLDMSLDGPAVSYARLSQQGVITICRVTGGEEEVVLKLPAHGKPIFHGPWLSPGGRYVAYGHGGTRVESAAALRVWKVDGPAPRLLLDDPADVSVSAAGFHGGGRWLAVGHAEGGVSVYDLESGQRDGPFPVGLVTALSFHPTERRLAVACGNVVRVLDCETGRELRALRPQGVAPRREGIRCRCLAWHPDGRRLAVGGDDSKIHLFDVEAGAEMPPPWKAYGELDTVAFNHVGDRLISSEWVEVVRLWEVSTGRPLLTLPRRLASAPAFSPDDGLLSYTRQGGKIRVWRLESGRELRAFGRSDFVNDEKMGARVFDPADPSGRVLAAGSPKALYFLDVKDGDVLADIPCTEYAAWPFAFDSAGGCLTCGIRGLIRWPYRPEPGRPELIHAGPPELIVSGTGVEDPGVSGGEPAASRGVKVWPGGPAPAGPATPPAGPRPPPDSGRGTGNWLFSAAGGDGKVLVIPHTNSAILIHPAHPDGLILGPQFGVERASVSPDGRWVMTGDARPDGNANGIRIWDGRTGAYVTDLAVPAPAQGHFSPDGRWLATFTGGTLNESTLWRVGNWTTPARKPFPGDIVFSPDGTLIAVNDVVGCLRLVDTETGKEVARLTGPEMVTYVPMCFSPDGTRLVGSKTMLYVWDLRAIRDQLRPLGLDWDSTDFPQEIPDTRGRLRLTVDAGVSAPEVPGVTAPTPPGADD